MKKLLRNMIIVSAIITGLAYYKSTKLPPFSHIDQIMKKDPVQINIANPKSFQVEHKDEIYTIEPKAEYEIYGLIVSQNDFDDGFNIDSRQDTFNSKDIGLIWGENLANDNYLSCRFWNNQYVLEWRYKGGKAISPSHISNSHLVSATEAIKKQVHRMDKGDQIHIKGKLVNYTKTINGRDFTRKTSLNRTDKGMGACEVIYVEELYIIKANPPFWGLFYIIMLSSTILLTITLLIVAIYPLTPWAMKHNVYKDLESDEGFIPPEKTN